jgi:hypothetical protein
MAAVADPASIYVRTPRGETLVLRPAQVVQRNLRIALMLVNGQHTTREIVEQFGDPMVANAALQDLLRSGLIRLKDVSAPTGPEAPATAAVPRSHLPPQRTEVPRGTVARDPREVGHVRAARARAEPAGSNDSSPGRRGAPRSDSVDGAEPAMRRRRLAGGNDIKRFEWRWRAALFFVVLSGLLAAAATVLLYPYDSHRAQAQAALSKLVGHPVKVARIGLALYPSPGLLMEEVAVSDGAKLAVAAIRILPDPLSLFGDALVLHEVALVGPETDAQSLADLTRRLAGGTAAARFSIRNLRFSDGTIRVGDAELSGFSGSAAIERNGALRLVRFASADGALTGELTPDAEGVALKLSATGWNPSLIQGATLDHFDGQGRLMADSLRFDSVEARLAEGQLKGQFSLSWNGVARADGRLEMTRVSAGKLLAQARPGLPLQGAINGAVRMAAQADRLSRLKDNFTLEGEVTVARGRLEHLDLVEAVRTAGTSRVRGGTTRFEELSARIRIDGQSTQLSSVRIQSGLLRADGQLAIGANQKVSGSVVVELRGSSGQVRMPLSISGTVTEPLLQS